MLTRFVLDVDSNKKNKIALIEPVTARLAAFIEEDKVYTDIWLKEEVTELLDTLVMLPYQEFKMTGNFTKFIIDNNYNVEKYTHDTSIMKSSVTFTFEGQYSVSLDDFNEHRKNVVKYMGYNAAVQASKKVEPTLVDWYLKKRTIRVI